MQTTVTGGALRVALRFSPAKPQLQDSFAFLQRRFTPRTVFMDIGAAGVSELALRAASYVERVYALVVSGRFLHNVPVPCNLRLVRCDGVRIPVPEASIDVAWSGRFLEPLRADERLEHLKSVRRSLAPGGVYFCASRAPFREAGFCAVRCYAGSVRIPNALAGAFSGAALRFAALK